jgi:hypothetical protein
VLVDFLRAWHFSATEFHARVTFALEQAEKLRCRAVQVRDLELAGFHFIAQERLESFLGALGSGFPE